MAVLTFILRLIKTSVPKNNSTNLNNEKQSGLVENKSPQAAEYSTNKFTKKTSLVTYKILEWFEVMAFGIYLVAVGYLIFTNVCDTQSCVDLRPTRQQFMFGVAIGFVVGAVLNSFRIAALYMLTDPDKEIEFMFYASVVVIFICFALFGLNFTTFEDFSARKIPLPSSYYWYFFLLVLAAILFIGEKDIWDKSNLVVKIRITLSFVYLLTLLVAPSVGLLLSLVFVPGLVASPMIANRLKD